MRVTCAGVCPWTCGHAGQRTLTRGFGNRPKLGGFIRNMSAVDRGVDWVPGNFQHDQCGLCDRGWH